MTASFFQRWMTVGWTPNLVAHVAIGASSRNAAKATLALKAAEY
jgi:hypothetical protein